MNDGSGSSRTKRPALVLVDSGTELAVNSPEDLSIRAVTVTAAELLVHELNKQQQGNERSGDEKPLTNVVTDWYLW